MCVSLSFFYFLVFLPFLPLFFSYSCFLSRMDTDDNDHHEAYPSFSDIFSQLISDSNEFLRSRFSFSLLSVLPLLLLLCILYSTRTSTSSSDTSVLHRSGKDPPRVALHKRVVDKESVKLALRQHYLAGYRYLAAVVISSFPPVSPPASQRKLIALRATVPSWGTDPTRSTTRIAVTP